MRGRNKKEGKEEKRKIVKMKESKALKRKRVYQRIERTQKLKY